MRNSREGKIGWILLWLLGIPLPILLRAGLNQVEKLMRGPVQSFDTGPCLRFPNQAQL
jgi:hypothetical protein